MTKSLLFFNIRLGRNGNRLLFISTSRDAQMLVQEPYLVLFIMFTKTKNKTILKRRNSYYGEAIIKEKTTCYPIVF